MRLLLFAFTLLSLNVFSQSDSIHINFVQSNDPDCIVVNPANGKYSIKRKERAKIKIPGAVFINPTDFDSTNLFSYSALMYELPQFDYDAHYYIPVNHSKVDTLIWEQQDSMFRSEYILDRQYDYMSIKELSKLNIHRSRTSQYYRDIKRKEVAERARILDSIDRHEHPRNHEIISGPIWSGSGILDGIYIPQPYDPNDYFNLEIPYFEQYPNGKDSIDISHKSIREKQVQPLIEDILEPFYLSRTEVTNKEYREFVYWVRDSLAREMIYTFINDDAIAATFLDHTDEYPDPKYQLDPNNPDDFIDIYDFEPSDRDENRKIWNLNWKTELDYEDPDLSNALSEMYYPTPARFYKRKEFDVRKYNYRSSTIDDLNIYPDTILMIDLLDSAEHYVPHMYFWHPYYDDYPVVGLSYNQMLAFCDWKQRKLNAELKGKDYTLEVNIPSLYQYELAAKETAQFADVNEVYDQLNTHFSTFLRDDQESLTYLRNVNIKLNERGKHLWEEKQRLVEFKYWYTSNFNEELRFMNGNVSEMTRDTVLEKGLDFYTVKTYDALEDLNFVIGSNYKMEVLALGKDQYNAIFYKRLQKKSVGSATTGFRLVYTIVKN